MAESLKTREQSRQENVSLRGAVRRMGPLALAQQRVRGALPFRAVNRRDLPGYDPGMQRHHLLPRQLLVTPCFSPLFEAIGRERIGFEDFRSNGLLLPASGSAAVRMGLPLHRGPHRDYNALVFERVGQVEASWSALRLRAPELALGEAVQRLQLLQKALRRRLLDPVRKRLQLSRHDPLGKEADFADLDAMVDMLWPATSRPLEVDLSLVSRLPMPAMLAPVSRPLTACW